MTVDAVENECLLDFEDDWSLFVMLGIIILSYVFYRCCRNIFKRNKNFLLNHLSSVNDERNWKTMVALLCLQIFKTF